ncbi:DHS-like NAD/FAD-binding domain-containing protein [Copromyces sp. CBS 386.78]|nr:DHS-like NAD/FAD-binding domain-containing protein [Copromyces sp. CBS 386.78]
MEPSNTADPLCPSLAPASVNPPDPSQPAKIPLLDPSHPLPRISPSQLPQCPRCQESGKQSPLRPGVVWFGESLDATMLSEIDAWIDQGGPVDIVLVVGTSSVVYPAAGYAERARTKGVTSVVTVNKEVEKRMWTRQEDLAFQGGAEEWLGKMFEPLIGALPGGGNE